LFRSSQAAAEQASDYGKEEGHCAKYFYLLGCPESLVPFHSTKAFLWRRRQQ
jgi:hypothetical protein